MEAEVNLKPAGEITYPPDSMPKPSSPGAPYINHPGREHKRSRQIIGANLWDNLCISAHLGLFQVLDGSFLCNSSAPSLQTSLLCPSRWGDSCGHQKLQEDKPDLLPRGRTTAPAMWTQHAGVRLQSTAGYKKPSKGKNDNLPSLVIFSSSALPFPDLYRLTTH